MYNANIKVPTKELVKWLLEKGYLNESFSGAELTGVEREKSRINGHHLNFELYDNLEFKFEIEEL